MTIEGGRVAHSEHSTFSSAAHRENWKDCTISSFARVAITYTLRASCVTTGCMLSGCYINFMSQLRHYRLYVKWVLYKLHVSVARAGDGSWHLQE